MKKSRVSIGFQEWFFDAILKKGILKKGVVISRLYAKEGGECNAIETSQGSWRCGLATTLLEFCFTDPDVGTLNPRTSACGIISSDYLGFRTKDDKKVLWS